MADLELVPATLQHWLIHPVVGDVDRAVAPELRAAIGRTMAGSASPVRLDLSAMSFIDAAGLGVLVWFAKEMRRQARPVGLHGASAMAERVLQVSGVAGLFDGSAPAPAGSWEG